ncbi:type VI secretion system tip protein VgrG, partial [Escherichia coli]|nr:type VI secretion system tip protein VgrG [Escherichia coli]
DNRIAEDAHYVYRHDEYGRLTEKTDRIPAGVIRTDDERTHHYHYDSQHRLVFYTRIQHGEPLVESRYLYDPLGRRMAKRVWRRERDLTGWMSLSRKPEVTWYGWDGDRLTTVQTDTTRIQTVYEPGSFTPLIRVETENGEREKAQRRSLAETLQQEGSENGHGVVFPAELVRLLDRLEEEIRADRVSSETGRQGAGTALENHFAVIPADRTWRPQPLLKPLVDGPQSAVVTGPAGEEIFCDEHGRVRVKFNWDRYNPSNQDSSCWIRVAQAWAGTGFGNLAIPRVGQEVIVDFLNGDPDQPIIMGRTYHHENRTPGSLPGTKTQMTIRSKTYKGSGFNELKFDDATGKEQVYIHAQKNMNTEVLNNRTTDVITASRRMRTMSTATMNTAG